MWVDLYHLVIASQIQRMQVIKQCFQVIPNKNQVSTGVSTDQESDPAPDTAPRRNTQVGGTQTSPPPQHRSDTVAGCTQTTPP